jgi:c(7)-type cytochrome triheme protein
MEATCMRLRRLCVVLPSAIVFWLSSAPAEVPTPEVRLPADLTYSGAKGSPGSVVFRHETHVPLESDKCTACHPEPFSILGSRSKITHAEMDVGKSCGSCHDGKTASGVQDDCFHCHEAGGEP